MYFCKGFEYGEKYILARVIGIQKEKCGQPRSQGLSLPAPQSERRETLIGSGHVPPGQIRT